jgi:electron transfer flavoprotein beta subunit
MRIAICIKQELDANGPFQLTYETEKLDTSSLVTIVDPASQAALSLTKALLPQGDHTITVMTVGNVSTERALRTCLSMGASEAIRIWDSSFEREEPSAMVVSRLLAAASKDYDLILCGSKSLCGSLGFIGPAIAESHGYPQISSVSWWEIDKAGKSLTAHRSKEHGDREIVRCAMPAVLTIDDDAADAPYPSFPAMLNAEYAEIQVMDLAALDLTSRGIQDKSSSRLDKYISPRPRTKKASGPDTSGMSAADMMKMLSGSGGGKSSNSVAEGTTDKVVKKMIEFLKKNELLS